MNREDLIHESGKHMYNFQRFETISYTKQKKKTKNKTKKSRDKKTKSEILLRAYMEFMKVEKWFLMLLMLFLSIFITSN